MSGLQITQVWTSSVEDSLGKQPLAGEVMLHLINRLLIAAAAGVLFIPSWWVRHCIGRERVVFRYLECFFDPLKVFPRRHFLHTPPNFQGVVNPLLSLAFSLQGILYEKLSQASTLRSSARCIALYWLLNRSAGRPVKLEVCNGEVCQLANEEIIDLKKYENSTKIKVLWNS